MIDLAINLGALALEAYSAFSQEERDINLAPVVGGIGVLAGAGALISNLLSDEALEDEIDDDDEILDLLLERLNFAEICVSLWAHCCMADGELSEEEDELTDELLDTLFADDSLFPEEIANQEVIYKELIDTFNNPLPIKSIIELGQSDVQLATNFYEEACLIFAADGLIAPEEREFLDELAYEFEISRMDKKYIERKYLAI